LHSRFNFSPQPAAFVPWVVSWKSRVTRPASEEKQVTASGRWEHAVHRVAAATNFDRIHDGMSEAALIGDTTKPVGWKAPSPSLNALAVRPPPSSGTNSTVAPGTGWPSRVGAPPSGDGSLAQAGAGAAGADGRSARINLRGRLRQRFLRQAVRRKMARGVVGPGLGRAGGGRGRDGKTISRLTSRSRLLTGSRLQAHKPIRMSRGPGSSH
jgi:hypothetical protein